MYNRQNLPLSFLSVLKSLITFETVMFGLIVLAILFSLLNTNLLPDEVMQDYSIQAFLWIIIIIFILRFFYRFMVAYLFYHLYDYNFGEEEIEITQGIIARSSGIVRYDRIQNVYLDQDLGDRFLGLYNVHFETAGEKSGLASHIDGLNNENANKLIEFLNTKIGNNVQSPKSAT